MNFSNPTTRFFIGCYLPIILELFIYEAYLYLKPDFNPDFIIFIITLPLILPLIFFYFVSPYLIFFATQSGSNYKQGLNRAIDDIFLAEKSVLTNEEINVVKAKLISTLIPELTKRFRSNYVNSYFTQYSQDSEPNSEESLLNFYETIFLFSFFSVVFSFFNAMLTMYLFSSSFAIEGIIIIDQIENLTNVVIFALVMLILGFSGLFLLNIVSRRILTIIPTVIPGLVNYSDERIRIQLLEVQAISDFNFDEILGIKLRNSREIVSSIYYDLLKDKIKNIIIHVSREQTGRKLAWLGYNEILEELGVDKKRRERLEGDFLSSPLIKTSQQFAFDTREALSLKEDFIYFNSTVNHWNEQSDSEKLSAFLLLYRSSESLFRGILRSLGHEVSNFGTMTSNLAEINLLTNDEHLLLNQVRKQRNHILHRAGEKISIKESFAKDFLKVIEKLLIRADKEVIANEEID